MRIYATKKLLQQQASVHATEIACHRTMQALDNARLVADAAFRLSLLAPRVPSLTHSDPPPSQLSDPSKDEETI